MAMKVGLDVDGVLANFNQAISKHHDKPFTTTTGWEVDWITDMFHTIEDDEQFWDNLPIISHPESITFDFDYYITSVPLRMKKSRERWLERHSFPDKPVIVTEDKLSVMKELEVDILIDDKFTTVKEVEDAGLLGIHFIPSYMEPVDLLDNNIKHLSQANSLIERYVEEKELNIR